MKDLLHVLLLKACLVLCVHTCTSVWLTTSQNTHFNGRCKSHTCVSPWKGLIMVMSTTEEEEAWCFPGEDMKRAEPWWPTSRTVSNIVSCCGLQVWTGRCAGAPDDTNELWLCNTCSTKPHKLITSKSPGKSRAAVKDQLWQIRLHVSGFWEIWWANSEQH